MNLVSRIRSLFSSKARLNSLYQEGLKKANNRDFAGAITDYTTLVQTWDVPSDLKAMAQLNRALAYSALREDDKAVADLKALLEASDVPPKVRSAAKEKLERIKKWSRS